MFDFEYQPHPEGYPGIGDFYIPEIKTLIEYQDISHFTSRKRAVVDIMKRRWGKRMKGKINYIEIINFEDFRNIKENTICQI